MLGRRVAVTGLGIICPLGLGVERVWQDLIDGRSGLDAIKSFDASELPCRIAGEVPKGSKEDGGFDPDQWSDPRFRRRFDLFILYAVVAARQAIDDAQWYPKTREQQNATGTLIGSGIGGLRNICHGYGIFNEEGIKRMPPFTLPSSLINLASGAIAIEHGFSGPNHSVVTACATGTHAIGDAARMIAMGDCDVVVAGGAEAAICPVGVAGFAVIKALSTTYNDTPTQASRPWDRGRDGFVMGEGAGVLVLEELKHAKARGAKIYCEITGYGLSGDAYHPIAPEPQGHGAHRSMAMALKSARCTPRDVDYINAHGTSTPLGDTAELQAVQRLFGEHASRLAMSSTKSAIGHLLGAAGAVEAIFTIKALQDGVIPPTLNLHDPDPDLGLDLTPLTATHRPISTALSNSFGFGGTNASLIFQTSTE